jgi:hypothetical protein
MIAGQDQHELGIVPAQDIEILVDGVGRALIPRGLDALLRRKELDELGETAVEKAPARCTCRMRLCDLYRGCRCGGSSSRNSTTRNR